MKRLLLAVTWFFLSGCGTTLQGGLSEGEANEILLVLAGADIAGKKVSQGGEWAVEVADSDLSRAFRVLNAAGLPRPKHTGFLGVYRERGLVPGRMEEQALYLSALQEEISKTLESVEGVASARVHVTARAEKKFQKAEAPPTASVLIGYHPDAGARPPISADEVKKIVANAVVGLARDRVAVVFSKKRKVAVPAAAAPTGGSDGLLRLAAAALAALAFCVSAFFFLRRRRQTRPAPLRHRRTAA